MPNLGRARVTAQEWIDGSEGAKRVPPPLRPASTEPGVSSPAVQLQERLAYSLAQPAPEWSPRRKMAFLIAASIGAWGVVAAIGVGAVSLFI